ncbi:SDR family oxidoreductase [Desulfallas sp. Bu1-1]|uniref:SDR family NAD(P)-dependent oxidoreductase n=1 Tax=Desulfallas sp. Bu1-1 TaxID=2787620 RepID=UPI0018A07961|nr:SDR family oxidoreductase [Desulfallas sp. Bu1-1]MBF7083003.1 SDR family oxidoreductase [Desulfallas sp. Bu1-1]
MILGLEGKTVVVTGGGSNIGRAVALGFAAEKSKVIIFDIDEAQGKKVIEAALKEGASAAEFFRVDVTDFDMVSSAIDTVKSKYLTIDCLINVVGWDSLNLFINTKPDFWERVIKLNYISVLNTTKAVLPVMTSQKQGVIINFASDAGRVGERFEAVYSGAKGAVIAFSKSVAKEMGRNNIRVNVVCPGTTVPMDPEAIGENSMWKAGPMTEEQLEKAKKLYPLGRLATPEDVAGATVFLASERAGFITGQTLSVSGGYTMV